MPSKQNIGKITEWKKNQIDRITIEPRKTLQIPARIGTAVEAGRASSRQEYIIKAILDALERDGIPEASRAED